MKVKTLTLLQATISLFFFFCLVSNMICLFAASWLTINESTRQFPEHRKYFGVIRICQRMNKQAKCYYRRDLLNFNFLTHNEAIILDVMFVALLGSSTLCFIALHCTFIMLKCQQKEKYMKCATVSLTILSFTSVILDLTPVVYLKVQLPNLPKGYEEGWTTSVGWSSVVLQVICTFCCFVMVCKLTFQAKPKQAESPNQTMHFPLERYFYGSAESISMRNFNARWFDERYSTTATNGYAMNEINTINGTTNYTYQNDEI